MVDRTHCRGGLVSVSFWKWYRFDLVPRHFRKPALLPVAFGLRDSRIGAGNEIPPDVPFAVDRCAADEHDARIGRRVQHHLGPLREDQHAAAFNALLADEDAAVDDIGGAFRVLARQRQLASGWQCNIGIEERPQRLDRRSLSVGAARKNPDARAGEFQ